MRQRAREKSTDKQRREESEREEDRDRNSTLSRARVQTRVAQCARSHVACLNISLPRVSLYLSLDTTQIFPRNMCDTGSCPRRRLIRRGRARARSRVHRIRLRVFPRSGLARSALGKRVFSKRKLSSSHIGERLTSINNRLSDSGCADAISQRRDHEPRVTATERLDLAHVSLLTADVNSNGKKKDTLRRCIGRRQCGARYSERSNPTCILIAAYRVDDINAPVLS